MLCPRYVLTFLGILQIPNQRPSKQITSNTAQNLIFFPVLLASFCILFMRAVCNHHQGVGQTKHPKSFLWLQESIGEALTFLEPSHFWNPCYGSAVIKEALEFFTLKSRFGRFSVIITFQENNPNHPWYSINGFYPNPPCTAGAPVQTHPLEYSWDRKSVV